MPNAVETPEELDPGACGFHRGDDTWCQEPALFKIRGYRDEFGSRKSRRVSCAKHLGRKVSAMAVIGGYYKVTVWHVEDNLESQREAPGLDQVARGVPGLPDAHAPEALARS